MSSEKVEFVDFDERALKKSWVWLHDPEIQYLTVTADFDLSQQKAWFESLKSKTDYYIKAIVFDGDIVGTFGLKNITDTEGEVWVIIGEKNLWNKNIGQLALDYVINYARTLGLKSIYAKYLKDNIRSFKVLNRNKFGPGEILDDGLVFRRLYL